MKFLSDSTLVLVIRVVAGFLSIATNFFLAKRLGPEGKGIISLLATVLGLIVLLASMSYQISGAYYAAKKQYSVSNILTITVFVTLVLSVITYICLVFSFPLLYTYLFRSVPTSYVVIVLSIFPFYLFLFYIADIFWAMSYQKYFAIVSLATVTVYFVGSIILVGIMKLDVFGALIAFVSGYICSAVLAILLVIKITKGKLNFNKSLLKQTIQYGLKVHIGRLSQQVAYRVDIPLVNYYSGLDSTGYYSIAVSLTELLWYIPRTVSFVLFPRIANMETQKATDMTSMLIRSAILVSAIVAPILYFSSRYLIFSFLPSYVQSLNIIILLLPGIVVSNIFQLLISDLLGRGMPTWVTHISVITGILAFVFYFLIIPAFGPQGAAISSSAVYLCQTIIAIWVWGRHTNTKLKVLLLPTRTDVILYRDIFCRLKQLTFYHLTPKAKISNL